LSFDDVEDGGCHVVILIIDDVKDGGCGDLGDDILVTVIVQITTAIQPN